MRWTQREAPQSQRKSIILLPYKGTHIFVELAVPSLCHVLDTQHYQNTVSDTQKYTT